MMVKGALMNANVNLSREFDEARNARAQARKEAQSQEKAKVCALLPLAQLDSVNSVRIDDGATIRGHNKSTRVGQSSHKASCSVEGSTTAGTGGPDS